MGQPQQLLPEETKGLLFHQTNQQQQVKLRPYDLTPSKHSRYQQLEADGHSKQEQQQPTQTLQNSTPSDNAQQQQQQQQEQEEEQESDWHWYRQKEEQQRAPLCLSSELETRKDEPETLPLQPSLSQRLHHQQEEDSLPQDPSWHQYHTTQAPEHSPWMRRSNHLHDRAVVSSGRSDKGFASAAAMAAGLATAARAANSSGLTLSKWNSDADVESADPRGLRRFSSASNASYAKSHWAMSPRPSAVIGDGVSELGRFNPHAAVSPAATVAAAAAAAAASAAAAAAAAANAAMQAASPGVSLQSALEYGTLLSAYSGLGRTSAAREDGLSAFMRSAMLGGSGDAMQVANAPLKPLGSTASGSAAEMVQCQKQLEIPATIAATGVGNDITTQPADLTDVVDGHLLPQGR
jgi:hypothetical protein